MEEEWLWGRISGGGTGWVEGGVCGRDVRYERRISKKKEGVGRFMEEK